MKRLRLFHQVKMFHTDVPLTSVDDPILLDFHSHPWQHGFEGTLETGSATTLLQLLCTYMKKGNTSLVNTLNLAAWIRLRISSFGGKFVIDIHFHVSMKSNLSKCNRCAQLSQACNILSCVPSAMVLIGCCKYLESLNFWIPQLSNCLFYKKHSKIEIQNGNNRGNPLLLLIF